MTLIAFIGSVFSPYYAWARRRTAGGAADPLNHCTLNAVLYGRGGMKRWAMTERGRDQVRRSATTLQIGPSRLEWVGEALQIRIDEVSVPWPQRLRGRITLHPARVNEHDFALDADGVHHWNPIAPVSRVEVEMETPGTAWSGPAYFDSNRGAAPLEAHFTRWHWSRAGLADGRTAVLYDVDRRDGSELSLALAFAPDGSMQRVESPPAAALPRTGWRVARHTRCDAGRSASVSRTLEDSPFYARSVLATHLFGEPATAVHESLSLQRFDTRWVQTLLPFRMPRRG